jgi:hypothetical protein
MMKRLSVVVGVVAFVVFAASSVYAQGTPVFDNLPEVLPGNVSSWGFQCCSTREFGDEIRLEAGTPRRAGSATVLMSSWSLHSSYPAMPEAGYSHPITLNIYSSAAAALAHAPAQSITQTFTIPWRPEADPACGTGWKAADGGCFNGLAFELTFDLRSLNYDLPSQFIYGVEYNTNTFGYHPLAAPGPYESLNVGFSNVAIPPVGEDVNADVLYMNTTFAGFYTDQGAGGLGTFRADTGWTGFPIGVKFTTFAVPARPADCKNGAWKNLVRTDFSAFQNQGHCVSYVNATK